MKAEANVMHESPEREGCNIRICLNISLRIKERVRVTAFLQTMRQEMLQRLDARITHIRVGCQIP